MEREIFIGVSKKIFQEKQPNFPEGHFLHCEQAKAFYAEDHRGVISFRIKVEGALVSASSTFSSSNKITKLFS